MTDNAQKLIMINGYYEYINLLLSIYQNSFHLGVKRVNGGSNRKF